MAEKKVKTYKIQFTTTHDVKHQETIDVYGWDKSEIENSLDVIRDWDGFYDNDRIKEILSILKIKEKGSFSDTVTYTVSGPAAKKNIAGFGLDDKPNKYTITFSWREPIEIKREAILYNTYFRYDYELEQELMKEERQRNPSKDIIDITVNKIPSGFYQPTFPKKAKLKVLTINDKSPRVSNTSPQLV